MGRGTPHTPIRKPLSGSTFGAFADDCAERAMPSKKQRAKKPGSKAALAQAAKKAATPTEDVAAEWLRQQLAAQQQAETEMRASAPIEGAKVPKTQVHNTPPEACCAESKSTARGTTAWSKSPSTTKVHAKSECDVHTGHAAAGELIPEMHTPGKEVHCEVQVGHAAMGELNPAMQTLHAIALDAGNTGGNGIRASGVALVQLLRDHGYQTMPSEWLHPSVSPLVLECVQTRTKKLELARKQRERRRENRALG